MTRPPAHPADVVRAEYNANASDTARESLKDLANWQYVTDAEWTALCRASADFAGVVDGDSVFEAGCGAGAFLAELLAYKRVTVAGVDFAEKLVEVARARVSGDFRVADVTDMQAVTGAYDKVVSHGVFLYLEDADAGARAAREMLRLTRPGGVVYIGIVNDPERRANAAHYDHAPSGGFAFSRAFWIAFARDNQVELEIVDQERVWSKPSGYDGYSRLRYSLRMRKSG